MNEERRKGRNEWRKKRMKMCDRCYVFTSAFSRFFVPKNVDGMNGSIILKELNEISLLPTSWNLTNEHFNGIRFTVLLSWFWSTVIGCNVLWNFHWLILDGHLTRFFTFLGLRTLRYHLRYWLFFYFDRTILILWLFPVSKYQKEFCELKVLRSTNKNIASLEIFIRSTFSS